MSFLVGVYLIEAHDVRRCYNIGFDSGLFVEIKNDRLVVCNEVEYLALYGSLDQFAGLSLYVKPQHKRGPLTDGFTFYTTSSFLFDRSSVRIFDWGEHSEKQKQQAFDAVVEYANAHPYYSQYRPGKPPEITFYPSDAAKAGVGLLGVLGLPALISWTLCYFSRTRQESTSTYRKNHSMCVHCVYSTKGLETPICPECGKHHGTAYTSLADSG